VRELEGDTMTLRGEDAGEGTPLVLLHGLSADRRNVLQGSNYLLRRGYRLISYDARGHGASDPPPNPTAYEYADLVGDLELVLADREIERPVLIGSSMGAATAMAWTLDHPDRVPALVQISRAPTASRTTSGSASPTCWRRAASTPSWRSRIPPTCPTAGAKPCARPPASASSATSTSAPSRARCG
jgi:pimeloyl-ACP methyl ester carboxylesterase